jgi:hypothetical protein
VNQSFDIKVYALMSIEIALAAFDCDLLQQKKKSQT